MDFVKSKLRKIKQLLIANTILCCISLPFILIGAILVVISQHEVNNFSDKVAGWSLLGVGLFIFLIFLISYIFSIIRATRIKKYLENPQRYMAAVYFNSYAIEKIAILKPKKEIDNLLLDEKGNNFYRSSISLDDEDILS